MNWVKRRKLLAIEAIQYNNRSYIKLNDLWNAFYNSFNSGQNQQVDIDLLKEISDKEISEWPSFSIAELFSAIKKCNNLSIPGPNKLEWRYIKKIIKDKECANRFIDIANMCFDLGHWPSYFKISTMVIIPKPNKSAYNSPKSFQPIILLNTTGKLVKKMIGERLQFTSISNNFIHSC